MCSVIAMTVKLVEQTFYRSAELYFADRAAMDAGFGSAEGMTTGVDYEKIAPPGSRLFVADLDA
jgi:hypothetical protein